MTVQWVIFNHFLQTRNKFYIVEYIVNVMKAAEAYIFSGMFCNIQLYYNLAF